MALMLFHGEEILALFGGAILGLGIFIGMLAWAFRGPKRAWTVPLVYLLVGLSISVVEIYTDNFFGLSVMFASPWSALLVFVSTAIGHVIGFIWFIPSIIINAAIVYAVARYQNRI